MQSKNKKSFNAQPFTEKTNLKKKIAVIYLYYYPSILISFNSESY